MRKKELIQIMMLIAGFCSYGYTETEYRDGINGIIWGDSIEPRFRKPAGYELETTKKLTVAYDNFFKVVDEYNREHGIFKRYVIDTYGKVPEYNENIDMVPVWIESGGGSPLKTIKDKYLTKEELNKIRTDKAGEALEGLQKTFDKDIEYRLYFGNGNKINNIMFKDTIPFDTMKKERENIKYLIDGKYDLFTQNDSAIYNSLNITEEEYKQNFLDSQGNKVSKNDSNLVKFVKSKFENLGIEVKEKDGELYTTKDGKDRRILWNAYTISIPKNDYMIDKDIYQNTVLTKVLLFKDFENKDEIIYSKDGDIVFKDVLTQPSETAKIKFDWSEVDDATEGKVYDKIAEDYLALKSGKIKKEDFNEKWGFKDDRYESLLSPIKDVNDKIENDDKVQQAKIEYIGGKGTWDNPSIYYDYFGWYDDKKESIKNGTDERVVKLLADKGITLEEFNNILNDIGSLKDDIERLKENLNTLKKQIPIKRFWVRELSHQLPGQKEVMLAGQGKIEGIIDLGHGYNTLSISENNAKYSGKFGTNITLGPYAQLKNIDIVTVGRQENSTLGSSGLSGVSSLAIEVDPQKYNKDGYLYQHALQNTWESFGTVDNSGNVIKPTRIIFRKAGSFMPASEFRNDFLIYFKTSVIGKNNTIIDMGRPLEYRDTMDNYLYKINLKPDSIAQSFKVLDEKTPEGHSLIKVKYKDEISHLNDNENRIYLSMVNSGQINALKDTLTVTNKKTIFSSPESDRKEKEKNMKLALYLKNKDNKSEYIIKELADFDIKGEDRKSLIDITEAIKDGYMIPTFSVEEKKKIDTTFTKIQKYRGMSKTLKKYKKINGLKAQEDMLKVVKEFSDVREDLQNLELSELTKRFGGSEKVQEKVDALKNIYHKNIEKFYNELVAAEPDEIKGEIEISILNSPGSSLRGQFGTGGLLGLKDVTGATPEEQLKNLISNYRTYSSYMESFNQLDENIIDNKMLAELQTEELFKQLRLGLFYTQRQTEALNEFRTILDQIYEDNIYSKVNKISKNSIDEVVPQLLDSKVDFSSKKNIAQGGEISGRYAKDKFKGTIYTGYGTYEKLLKDKLSVGLVVSGSRSDFSEILNDNIKEVSTESKVRGTSAYVGTFARYNIKNNTTWMNGIGVQYARYDVDRDMKNNYQEKKYKGKLNTYSGNIYSALSYKYKINDSLDLNVKTGIAYTSINQGKATENREPLSMEVKSQQFNYLDGQAGVGITKSIYDNDITSQLSGTIYAVYGILGYKNNNLKGKFAGSSSDFDIKGESYSKQAIKLKLDYDVNYDTGLNYGISASYTKNEDENNISVGVKAGYKF